MCDRRLNLRFKKKECEAVRRVLGCSAETRREGGREGGRVGGRQ